MQSSDVIDEIKTPQGRLIKVYKDNYVKLEEVSTDAATSSKITFENIKKNLPLKLPKIEKLPEYRKIKGHDVPIAIVGGGPSLKNHIDELKGFRTILACGSVHDYLRSQDIVPTYAAICDPDPVSINYYRNLHTEVKYLLATSVDVTLLEHFKDYQRILWHCHSADFNVDEIEKLEGTDYHAISGGCTVGLRGINICIMLGYTNIHFFGFDSCMDEEQCHAYAVSAKERKDFGRLFEVKLRELDSEGPSEKRVFKCVGYQLAQAYAFRDYYLNFGRLFTPTFHGDGLMSGMWELIVHILGVDDQSDAKLTRELIHVS